MEDAEACGGCVGSIAISIAGTFFATCLAIAVVGLLYRRWKRNKGKHLVLVTDPETVKESYAFDNPCFKDCSPAGGRSLEQPTLLTIQSDSTPVPNKENNRWQTAWSHIGKADKRRTLDDSCLGSKTKTVSVVALRSRDFTGLGFNICGNMREGIFVKGLMHRGPASESGRIHSGDRISSVKISFRSMVYEDALTILSYASPYDVEIEVESGGDISSKPTTILKRSISPSATHFYHPLYRSQSIPNLSYQQHSTSKKHNQASKRLFEPNDSIYTNYTILNSTGQSSKSTPVARHSSERRNDELKTNNHHHPQFGIKVLPALDGTVHRIENQNEHNTNLERRHSKKLEVVEKSNGSLSMKVDTKPNNGLVNENLQQLAPVTDKKFVYGSYGIDVPDRASEIITNDNVEKSGIPSQVPVEVHNAAMAARRNRKSSNIELLQRHQSTESSEQSQQESDSNDVKSPQKSKRKAPAPPTRTNSTEENVTFDEMTLTMTTDAKTINDIGNSKKTERATVTTNISDKPTVKEESNGEVSKVAKPPASSNSNDRQPNSESDTDSEIQNNFTTIELNSSEVIIHHTPPVPEAKVDNEEDDDSVYRKAASLGDLSMYENKALTTLERAQSLDMTADAGGLKKRKAPAPPPEDIHESTEDLTKLDQIDSFECRKLKKSNEWGTLEDALFRAPAKPQESLAEEAKLSLVRKKSNEESESSSLEHSKFNMEMKLTKSGESSEPVSVSDGALETSLELYNLPLTKKLTQDFIKSERLFDPDEDNALSRLVNDGDIVKSPSPEQVGFEFQMTLPPPDNNDDDDEEMELELETPEVEDSFEKAIQYFDMHSKKLPSLSSEVKVNIPEPPEELYTGRKEVVEEPMIKVTRSFVPCPGCKRLHDKHLENCEELSYHQTIRVEEPKSEVSPMKKKEKLSFGTHFAKPIINITNSEVKSELEDEDDDEAVYEFGAGVTINSKTLSPSPGADKRNVSSVSVSSGENSEDSGLVRENKPPKMSYVTEIKVSSSDREEEALSENEEIISIMGSGKRDTSAVPSATVSATSIVTLNVTSNGKLPTGKKPPVPPRRSDATRYMARTDASNPEKQIVYVSEQKSITKVEDAMPESSRSSSKFDNWITVTKDEDKEQMEVNPWGN